MARCIVRNKVTLCVFLAGVLTAHSALAQEIETGLAEATVKKGKKVPYRGSSFTWGHSISALTLDKSAESTYNPYYAQAFDFKPRWYLRDDLSLRARFVFEVEMTDSDSLDSAHGIYTTDLSLEANYAPKWMKIPFLDISVNPSLRIYLPTGTFSKRKSLLMTIAPGVALRRSFTLLKGKFLKEIGLVYGFRFSKYLNGYETASLDSTGICGGSNIDPSQPSCVTSGARNVSYRIVNTFGFNLKVMEKLTVGATLMVINDMLYDIEAGTYEVGNNNPSVALGASEINHKGSLWGVFSIDYDVLPWMSLSLGTSTFYNQLANDSSYRGFFFNRYTNFTFDVTIPIDKFVAQIQDWRGKGGADEEGREEK